MTLRRTPFHALASAMGAQMGPVGGGFLNVHSYGDVAAEHLNTRARVGVQDLSTMGKIDVKGPEAEALVDHIVNLYAPLPAASLGYLVTLLRFGAPQLMPQARAWSSTAGRSRMRTFPASRAAASRRASRRLRPRCRYWSQRAARTALEAASMRLIDMSHARQCAA